jgi:dTDP-4-dehydrorhamnose reductase
MKILLLGKNGQLGTELEQALAPLGQLTALDRSSGGDLSDLCSLAETIRRLRPDILVNAAAYTAVDKAETEPELVSLINTLAPAVMAEEAKDLDAWFVHYSTDYVFNGEGESPWKETDLALPLNVYGQTKLEAERRIQASGCRSLIFRTAWVYGQSGSNFPKTILSLAKKCEEFQVVSDQIGVPTGARFLADYSVSALNRAVKQPALAGLYHLVPQGEISWYDYASYLVKKAKALGQSLRVKKIKPVLSRDYPSLALRPLNSRLATTKFRENFDLPLPHWEDDLTKMLQGIL